MTATGPTPPRKTLAPPSFGYVEQSLTFLFPPVKVIVHLRSKSWETRVAAGQAIEAIAANVPEWNPVEDMETEDSNSPHPPPDTTDMNKLTFATFDLSSVLAHGKLLLGSAGKEYDIDMSDMTPQERLALQRKNLKERLGLGSQFMDGKIPQWAVIVGRNKSMVIAETLIISCFCCSGLIGRYGCVFRDKGFSDRSIAEIGA